MHLAPNTRVRDWARFAAVLSSHRPATVDLRGLLAPAICTHTTGQLQCVVALSFGPALAGTSHLHLGAVSQDCLNALVSGLTSLRTLMATVDTHGLPFRIDMDAIACNTQLSRLDLRSELGMAMPAFSFRSAALIMFYKWLIGVAVVEVCRGWRR